MLIRLILIAIISTALAVHKFDEKIDKSLSADKTLWPESFLHTRPSILFPPVRDEKDDDGELISSEEEDPLLPHPATVKFFQQRKSSSLLSSLLPLTASVRIFPSRSQGDEGTHVFVVGERRFKRVADEPPLDDLDSALDFFKGIPSPKKASHSPGRPLQTKDTIEDDAFWKEIEEKAKLAESQPPASKSSGGDPFASSSSSTSSGRGLSDKNLGGDYEDEIKSSNPQTVSTSESIDGAGPNLVKGEQVRISSSQLSGETEFEGTAPDSVDDFSKGSASQTPIEPFPPSNTKSFPTAEESFPSSFETPSQTPIPIGHSQPFDQSIAPVQVSPLPPRPSPSPVSLPGHSVHFDAHVDPDFPFIAPRARGLFNVPKGHNLNRKIDEDFKRGFRWIADIRSNTKLRTFDTLSGRRYW